MRNRTVVMLGLLWLFLGLLAYYTHTVDGATLTIDCPGSTWSMSSPGVVACTPGNTPPPQGCPPGQVGTPPNCTTPPSSDFSNCTNQGFTVIPSGGRNLGWGVSLTLRSADVGSFGDHVVWLGAIAPPAGTGASTTLGYTAVSEYQGPPTSRQMSISKTPCDFRPKDYTGANGPLSVSNGTTATIYYGVGTPQAFGGTAYLTAGTTYWISTRNWSVDFNNWSCGQATCNAIMNVQPASP